MGSQQVRRVVRPVGIRRAYASKLWKRKSRESKYFLHIELIDLIDPSLITSEKYYFATKKEVKVIDLHIKLDMAWMASEILRCFQSEFGAYFWAT